MAQRGPGTPLRDPEVAELLASTTASLAAAGSETARLDAELLVGHAFGRERAWLHAHPDAALEPGRAAELADWTRRRAAGEPVAYIRGFKEWFGLRVAVDPRALIPRPETEHLVEAAIAEIAERLAADDRGVVAWDVATGSGAVALALALRFRAALTLRRVRLVASDIAPDALELAAENLAAHGVAPIVTVALGDLLEGAGARDDDPPARLPLPDVVTANLPYLSTAEVSRAEGSIAFEPRAALDGGPDGLDAIRRLVGQLPYRLAPGGVALLEMGAGQADTVRTWAEGLTVPVAVTVLPDLAGIERVARIARLDR
jgi:release factor glutamine methyltransferase